MFPTQDDRNRAKHLEERAEGTGMLWGFAWGALAGWWVGFAFLSEWAGLAFLGATAIVVGAWTHMRIKGDVDALMDVIYRGRRS